VIKTAYPLTTAIRQTALETAVTTVQANVASHAIRKTALLALNSPPAINKSLKDLVVYSSLIKTGLRTQVSLS
jgi:hypothetical protein